MLQKRGAAFLKSRSPRVSSQLRGSLSRIPRHDRRQQGLWRPPEDHVQKSCTEPPGDTPNESGLANWQKTKKDEEEEDSNSFYDKSNGKSSQVDYSRR